MSIPEPVLNEDFYMVKLIGGDVTLPTPRTRFEELLYIYAGGTIERPTPKTVEERFLDYLTGGASELPTPKTRLQSYMYNVANPTNKIPVVPPKTRFECYWFVMATANQWESVQRIVRNGTASKIFPIGTKMYCHRGNDILEWDVIGIDHDTPTDPRFTHSLTLQLHDCFPTSMQFDAPEAFYYAENGLEAGTYHFTVSGVNYQFTVPVDGIAADSQLILGFTSGIPSTITVASTKGGTVSEGSITVTVGSGGDELVGVNNINRVNYGSNNYKESAIRQWLNSGAAAEAVWVPQTDFDRPPNWHTGRDGTTKQGGFMNGMDADFLAVLGKTEKVTARNAVTDGGGVNGLTKSDITDDYFFLLSREEIYAGVEVNGVDEGTAYPYYADYSDLPSAGTGNDSNRIKYINGSTQPWWLRTPNSGDSGTVRSVNMEGTVYYHYARVSIGVAPACNII